MKRFIAVTALVLFACLSQAQAELRTDYANYTKADYSKQCSAANHDPSHPACCAQRVENYVESAQSTLVGGPGSKSKAQSMLDKAVQLRQASAGACQIEVEMEAIMVGLVLNR